MSDRNEDWRPTATVPRSAAPTRSQARGKEGVFTVIRESRALPGPASHTLASKTMRE